MDKERFDWILSGIAMDSLTEWETEFIESCQDRMGRYGGLTIKQEEKLEEIFKQKGR